MPARALPRPECRSPLRTEDLQTVFDACCVGIVVADARTRVIAVNPAYTELTGRSAEDVVGRPLRALCRRDEAEAPVPEVRAALAREGHWWGEMLLRRGDGSIGPVWVSLKAATDQHGRVGCFVATLSDLGELRRNEARLHHLAHHDPLTGLPNRLLFDSELVRCIARARRNAQQFALLFIDIDHFKMINDTLGHAAGDQVLREVGRRLRQSVRAGDLVARLGGDEFTVVLENLPDTAEASRIAIKMLASIGLPIEAAGQSLGVSGSIGIAFFPGDADDGNELIHAADKAMYYAKNNTRGTFELTGFG